MPSSGGWQSGWKRAAALAVLTFDLLAAGVFAAELKQETVQAFERYVTMTDEQRAQHSNDPDSFLWIDRQPPARRRQLHEQLEHGQAVVERLETRDGKKRIRIPHGLAHHWIAVIFVPGATLRQTLAFVQAYEQYPDIYKGSVKSARVLSHEGADYQVRMRFYRKSIVTVFYNVDFDDHYSRVDAHRATCRAHSTRIAELADPGKPSEHELPAGNDRGYLWRLNTDWSYEEKDGGVYLQVELISLSRSVPAIWAWLVNPYLRSVPQEYLAGVLVAMRTNLMTQPPPPSPPLPPQVGGSPHDPPVN
ncbi:MAG TPA: hypothetical protein VEU52_02000 [Candidatus Limnocylindrales bacterium]|nr:hypothetical protein [Candidatus Limnocylindrales bacterium]